MASSVLYQQWAAGAAAAADVERKHGLGQQAKKRGHGKAQQQCDSNSNRQHMQGCSWGSQRSNNEAVMHWGQALSAPWSLQPALGSACSVRSAYNADAVNS